MNIDKINQIYFKTKKKNAKNCPKRKHKQNKNEIAVTYKLINSRANIIIYIVSGTFSSIHG